MKKNIGILTFPISEAGIIPLSYLIDIVYSLSNDTYLITGNDGYTFFKEDKRIHAYGIRHGRGRNVFTRILKYIYIQLKISYKLAKITKNVDMWIFFIGGTSLLFPMLTAKLLRKDVVLAFAGSPIQTLISANDNLSKPVEILSTINYILSDRIGIAIKSESLIRFCGLEKYRTKIVPMGSYYLNTNLKIKKRLNERDNIIGYVGRLSEEKGVLEFARAIPFILSKKNDVRFLIVGDGRLMENMKNILEKAGCLDKVEFTGWVPHEKIPDYFNEMKFHIHPSHTEAFGGAIEAMACGTIAIATPVGGLPDVITDGKTGFLLKDNQPQTIANKVLEICDHPELDEIQRNAKEF
jgi:glycosyltransferase involved in cell wall biosynthesis